MARIALMILLFFVMAEPLFASPQNFAHFSVDLPADWNGEESSNFTPERGGEYMLVFKRHDEAGENIRGVVSVFLLPPLSNTTEEIAEKLAGMQEDSSPPQKDGNFWTFTGEPRTQGFKASAQTWVNSSPAHVLIVIVQDPDKLGGEKIFTDLRALTPEAKEVLGR
ncbi:MAG: protoporphyrinogen oxidase [Desulfovibrio sp.]|jgi:hypothetical protein|nr:protoporphyrinogen oxidase [Desulfovibrio sp.]